MCLWSGHLLMPDLGRIDPQTPQQRPQSQSFQAAKYWRTYGERFVLFVALLDGC
jgi:hypothetical protein